MLGSSRMLGDALRHQPEFVRTLGEDDELKPPKRRRAVRRRSDRDGQVARETTRTRAAAGCGATSGASCCASRRAIFSASRISSPPVASSRTLADACLEAALATLAPQVPFAVIGMGRFGGRDLSYASDLDVLFVYEGDGPSDYHEAERVAEQLLTEIGERTPDGRIFAIDAALRPEGKQGSLTRSFAGYRNYWERWGLTWEFQSLIKARPAAGDLELGQRFCDLAQPFVYRDALPGRRGARGPADEGAHRAGADPTGRRPAVPPEARAGLALGHRVHRAAAPAAARRAPRVAAHSRDDDRARRAGRDRAARSGRRRCVARVVRALLRGPQRPLPRDRLGARVPAQRYRGGRARRRGCSATSTDRRRTLRDDYRRVTRHARQVVERVFYGRE